LKDLVQALSREDQDYALAEKTDRMFGPQLEDVVGLVSSVIVLRLRGTRKESM